VKREISIDAFINTHIISPTGLNANIIAQGVNYTYAILDRIDETLLSFGAFPLSK
jgi:hypothetical protein